MYGSDIRTCDPLSQLSALTSLDILVLEGEEAYPSIARITQLRHLRLTNGQHRVRSWKEWAHLTNLVSFSFGVIGWPCNSSFLDAAELFALTQLTRIDIVSVGYPPRLPSTLQGPAADIGSAFARLATMNQLVDLRLGHLFTVDAVALAALARMPQLLYLGIGRVQGPLEWHGATHSGVCPLLRGLYTALDLRPTSFLDTLLPFAPLRHLQGELLQDEFRGGRLQLSCGLRRSDHTVDRAEHEALDRIAHLLADCPDLRLESVCLRHGATSLKTCLQPLQVRFPHMRVMYTGLCDPWIPM